MKNIPLDLQFFIERLRRYLEQNPDDANRLAIAHFVDFSLLAIKYKKLEIENSKLRSATPHRKVSLPPFTLKNRGL